MDRAERKENSWKVHAIHSLIQQIFIEYLFDTVLGTKDTTVSKKEWNPCLCGTYIAVGETVNKQKKKQNICNIRYAMKEKRKQRREIKRKNLGWGL